MANNDASDSKKSALRKPSVSEALRASPVRAPPPKKDRLPSPAAGSVVLPLPGAGLVTGDSSPDAVVGASPLGGLPEGGSVPPFVSPGAGLSGFGLPPGGSGGPAIAPSSQAALDLSGDELLTDQGIAKLDAARISVSADVSEVSHKGSGFS